MTRRALLMAAAIMGVGLATGAMGQGTTAGGDRPKRVLFFSKSTGWEHSVIKREGGELSFAEKILQQLGPKHGIEFTFSKDGSLFTPEYLAGFDAYFFYTSGDLSIPGTDKNPPISAAGKRALLDAIAGGKGFVGCHSAADSWHTHEAGGTNPKDRTSRYRNYGEESDPYLRMLGGEFIRHGDQQSAKVHVINPAFPGFERLGPSWDLHEEWYSLKDFVPDLHVLLVQDTAGMKGLEYQRPNFPNTWARLHGKGRVFYTALGHREDVWENDSFQAIVFGGLRWATGQVEAETPANLGDVAPGATQLPPQK